MRLWIGSIEQTGRPGGVQRFRFRVGSGRRASRIRSFPSREEAERERAKAVAAEDRRQRQAAALTLELALIEYRDWYEREGPRGKGAKAQSVRRETMRVALLVPPGPLREPTVDQVRAWYRALQARVSVAEHQAALKACRRFGRWLVEDRRWKANPFAAVRTVGQPKRGKRQLSIDDGRKWVAGAFALAHAGDAPVLCALACLLLGGRRAMEVGGRVCSELDDGGRVLRIASAKTAAGVMTVPVLHEELRELLAAQQARAREWGRAQAVPQLDPPLFPPISVEPTRKATGETVSSSSIRRAVQRVCRAEGLPDITTHSLRGMFASYSVEVAQTLEAVGRVLGQRGTQTAERHYVGAEAQAIGQQRSRLAVLAGGADRASNRLPTLAGDGERE